MNSAEIMEISKEELNSPALESLILAVAEEDRSALASLYGRTRKAVYAVVLSYLKNADDAQDITQDVYVRIWDNAGKYRSRGSPMAWILAVAKNLALMRLRESSRSGELSEEQWQAIPSKSGISAEDRLFLQESLASLGDEERRIVLLHASAGLKHREIASLLNVPLATVLSRYNRAIKKLNTHTKGDDE